MYRNKSKGDLTRLKLDARQAAPYACIQLNDCRTNQCLSRSNGDWYGSGIHMRHVVMQRVIVLLWRTLSKAVPTGKALHGNTVHFSTGCSRSCLVYARRPLGVILHTNTITATCDMQGITWHMRLEILAGLAIGRTRVRHEELSDLVLVAGAVLMKALLMIVLPHQDSQRKDKCTVFTSKGSEMLQPGYYPELRHITFGAFSQLLIFSNWLSFVDYFRLNFGL